MKQEITKGELNVPVANYTSRVAPVVSCYCFNIVAAVIVLWLGDIVSVVCSVVLSRGCKPFM